MPLNGDEMRDRNNPARALLHSSTARNPNTLRAANVWSMDDTDRVHPWCHGAASRVWPVWASSLPDAMPAARGLPSGVVPAGRAAADSLHGDGATGRTPTVPRAGDALCA